MRGKKKRKKRPSALGKRKALPCLLLLLSLLPSLVAVALALLPLPLSLSLSSPLFFSLGSASGGPSLWTRESPRLCYCCSLCGFRAQSSLFSFYLSPFCFIFLRSPPSLPSFSLSLPSLSLSTLRPASNQTDKPKNAATPRTELAPAPAPGAMEAAAADDADATLNFIIESKSSVFDPGSGRFSLKGVSPIVSAVTLGGPAGERGLARLVAADFYPSLKGAADVVVAGDRNGTADRYFLRLSDAAYDRQTASVDFKAEMRSSRDPPLLKNGAVAATQTGTDKDRLLKVLTPTGRPVSLNNVMVVADARAPKGVGKGVLPAGATGAAGECAGWGCALKA